MNKSTTLDLLDEMLSLTEHYLDTEIRAPSDAHKSNIKTLTDRIENGSKILEIRIRLVVRFGELSDIKYDPDRQEEAAAAEEALQEDIERFNAHVRSVTPLKLM